jgi:hypothetical protein
LVYETTEEAIMFREILFHQPEVPSEALKGDIWTISVAGGWHTVILSDTVRAVSITQARHLQTGLQLRESRYIHITQQTQQVYEQAKNSYFCCSIVVQLVQI